MSLALLWPAALLGLLGLAVPLLLHWLPRRDSRPRRFAALRYIGAHAAPRRQRRLSEWPLLCLRLALLACLVLWLAGPRWLDWPGRGLHWQAVWPGVSADALASVTPADRQVWLAPGFPPLGETALERRSDSASLLRELAAELPPADRLSVLVPADLEGLDADRLRLARDIDWQILAGTPLDAQPTPLRRLALRSEPGAVAGPWIEAALASLEADPALAIQIERGPSELVVPADADAVLWIGDAPMPRWQGRPRPMLQVPSRIATDDGEADSWPLLQHPHARLPWRNLPGGGARLPGPAVPAHLPAVLDADFPGRLHHLLFHRDATPTRAPAAAMRPSLEPRQPAPVALPLSELLALLAALLLLAERWLASGPRLRSAS